MPRQYFSINREIFDIDFTSKSGAYDLQSRISSLVNGTLTRQMEQLLEKTIPENFLYKIDSLTVEVGTVNIDNLEQELPEKFMEAFATVLNDYVRQQRAGVENDNFQVLPTAYSLTELLDYFLYTGHLPWWAVKNESFTPSLVLQELLRNNAGALRLIIMRAGQHEHVRRRLVRQFSRDEIRGIIQVLEPGEAAFIFGFEENIVEVKKTEGLVQADEKEFEEAINYFVLTYLIVDRGGDFNRKEFAKSILGQIAFNFNMQYVELLHVLYAAIEQMELPGNDRSISLKLLIRELAVEAYEDSGWKKKTNIQDQRVVDQEETIRKLNIIKQYLISGTLPFSIDVQQGGEDELRSLLLRLASAVSETFQLMLAQLSWNKDVTDRLFKLLSITTSRQYLKNLYGSRIDGFVKIAATFSLLHKTKQTWVVSEQVYEEGVWKSVLAATLLSPINLVDERQLIRFLVKGLSTHLSVPVQVVAQRIETGVKAIFQVDQMQMRHLDLITEVLAEMKEGNELSLVLTQTEINKNQELTDSLFSTETQLLSHLLRFLLQNGSLPWWGRSHAGKSPAMLFQQLQAQSLVEAQLLFRWAGASSQIRQKWLQTFGKESFLLMLQHADHSAIAAQAYKIQMELLAVLSASLQKDQVDIARAALVTADIGWDVLHVGHYQSFSLSDFYIKIYFAWMQVFQTEPAVLLAEWQRWEEMTGHMEGTVHMVLKTMASHYPVQSFAKPTVVLSEQNSLSVSMATLMAGTDGGAFNNGRETSVQAVLQLAEHSVKEKITVHLLGVLKSYLLTGHLPPFIAAADTNEKIAFFRQLLEIVYTISPLQLINLLSGLEANPFRMLEITSYYQSAEGGKAKDIALMMLPVRNKWQAAIRLQTVEEIKIQGKREQEIFVEDMLLAFSGEQAVIDATKKPGMVYHILRYYLTWNRLPETLLLTGKISGDMIVRHLLRYLLLADQQLMEQLLNEKTNQPIAVMSVNAILMQSETGDDKKIIKLIGQARKNQPSVAVMPMEATLVSQIAIPVFSTNKESVVKNEIEEAVRSGVLKQALRQQKGWVAYLAETGNEAYKEAFILYKNEWYSTFEQDSIYVERLIASVFTDTLLRERILTVFRFFNLQSLVQGLMFRDREAYFSQLLHYLTGAMPNAIERMEQLYAKEAEKKDAEKMPLLPLLTASLQELKDIELAGNIFNKFYEDRDMSLTSRDRLLEQQKIAESLERELKSAKEKERIQEAEEAAQKQQEKNVKLFIPNAGLVILHPFFSTYFTRLQLMQNSVFISIEAKERAVLLLQYIATGRSKFDEYELILNKILCGLPIEQAVAFEIELTEAETTLTEELFDVLRQRWDKVKNSSVEGIRASFIQREGALEFIEDQWNLRVEQRGYDMLLQTLPWAFGFIKTSWMNQILTVEWI